MRDLFVAGIGIPDFLNPFEWIEDKLDDLFDDLVKSFNQVFINPPQPKSGAWEEYLYGNAIGLAGVIAMTVSVLVLCIAMFYQRRMISLLQAGAFSVFIAAAYPAYFAMFDWLKAAGADLAKAANWYKPKDKELLDLPDIANALGSILGLGSVTFWGGFLVGIFYLYALIFIMVKFFGMIALAMSPLGDRSKKFLSWMISLGLVTTVFGPAGAVFAVNLGSLGADQIAVGGIAIGNTGFGKTFIITAALILAIILQAILIWATLKVTNNVVGHVHSRVFGQVDSMNKQKEERGHGGLETHLGTKGTVPVYIVEQPEMAHGFKANAGRLGGSVVMHAASKVHPAASMAAKHMLQRSGSKNGKSGGGS